MIPGQTVSLSARTRYGWVVVVTTALMLAVTYGLMYSYSVFFKPLADYFQWDRATVSLVYSASLVIRGAVSIGTGYLADRFGAARIMVACGFFIGLGLALSSQVQTLWQFFLTYAVIEAIGLSGTFGIGTAMISRWFTKNRGLALGIFASGSGLGTLFIVPGVERLIDSVDWSQAFLICGLASGVFMMAAAFLLRPPPASILNISGSAGGDAGQDAAARAGDTTPGRSLRDPRMLLLMAAFLTYFFGIQIVMVHLVNHATDIGINPLVAATFISVIGAVSIASRLSIGAGADRMGIHNSLILTRVFLIVSFVFLLFTRSVWSFYLFAVLFSIPYGGEIPQIPLYIGKYFGTKSMATLMGLNLFVITVGGALGPWITGNIFDNTGSYRAAFIAGAFSGALSLALVLVLKRKNRDIG